MAASGKQPFEVTDFSGGMTDEVFSVPSNTSYMLDNYILGSDTKPYSRAGSQLDDPSHSPIPLGNSRIGALMNYARNTKLFVQASRDVYYRPNSNNTGTWSTLTGPSGNLVFTANTTANFISSSEWNKQIFVVSDSFATPMRIYKDGSGAYQVRNAGLPLMGAPTVTPGTSGANNYIYAFHLLSQFQADQNIFEDLGPTVWVTVGSSGDPSVNSNAITAIPVLTNSGNQNFDTTNIKVEIYRTINNGTNFYKIGEVTNGTTTFTDTFADADIQENLQLYTNDGTLDYYPPPLAKFVKIVNNMAFYGYTQDTDGTTHAYRVHQSIPGNPALVPQTTWTEVTDEVTGLGSVRDSLPILLCKKLIHRLDGNFTSAGAGNLTAVEIHATAGCISNASVVTAENWCFWAGNDGFYSTDGYQVIKISDHLNARYKAMIAASQDVRRIQGKYDEINRLIYWSVSTDASNLEQDSLWVLDLKWGITPKSVFTTWSGNSFRPTAIEVFNGDLYRGDNNGFVFEHDSSFVTDPKVNTGISASTWSLETIIWNLMSVQFNFGGSFFRKFVSRILMQANNLGNTTIQITAINDQGSKVRPLKLIRWRRNFTWSDPDFVWGNTDCIWDAEGLIQQWRRMPAGGLRLSYLQIQITNGLGIVANSDSDGLATLTRSSKQFVLPGLWPSDSVDYFISFETDNYTRQYQVSAINTMNDTITLLDPNNKLPANGTYAWELAGYKKGEQLNLIGYNLHWDQVDQNQGAFQAGDLGGNS